MSCPPLWEDRHDVSGERRVPAGQPGGGQWTRGGGGSKHARTTKAQKAAARYRSPMRRRRVYAALKAEGDLAEAVEGYWFPDSLPFDVLIARDATGSPVTSEGAVKTLLARRALAVRVLQSRKSSEEQRKGAEKLLSLPCEAVEVKVLLVSARHAVHMSREARGRKERWAAKYAAGFHVVALDRRKGRKHSGHEVHLARGELSGTHRLEHMEKVTDLAGVLDRILPGQRR
jgi:hypothetical protein